MFIVLYDADAVGENDMQCALGAKEGCRDASVPRSCLGSLNLRSESWYGIGIEGSFSMTTGNEYVIDIELWRLLVL